MKLKKIREQRGETQEHIAKILKISRTSISKYESGDREPDIEMIKILSNHYGVSVDYILGLSDELDFYDPMSETSDTDYMHENALSYITPFNRLAPEIELLLKDE